MNSTSFFAAVSRNTSEKSWYSLEDNQLCSHYQKQGEEIYSIDPKSIANEFNQFFCSCQ